MRARVAAGCLAALLVPPGIPGGPPASVLAPSALEAQEVLTQEQALEMAFPRAGEIRRRTAFLDEARMERAEELAAPAVKVEEPVVTYYVATRDGSPLGVAYFDAHEVRTLPEVLMVVVTPEGEVGRIEVLKFNEPQEYRPPDGWLEEFRGKSLADRVSTSGSIVNITGATLTSRAVTRAVRRVLALHRVIDPWSEETGSATPDSVGSLSEPDAVDGAGARRRGGG